MLEKLELDHGGIAEILKSQCRGMVDEAAQSIASNVNVDAGGGVEVTSYTTDRAAAAVTILDARGLLWQSRDGVLTRAASAAGAEVRSR